MGVIGRKGEWQAAGAGEARVWRWAHACVSMLLLPPRQPQDRAAPVPSPFPSALGPDSPLRTRSAHTPQPSQGGTACPGALSPLSRHKKAEQGHMCLAQGWAPQHSCRVYCSHFIEEKTEAQDSRSGSPVSNPLPPHLIHALSQYMWHTHTLVI